MLFVGADGLYYPLIFAVMLVTRHAKGGGERLASCGAMDGLYCKIVG